jgi:Skp family chaperone for outer membrane proteins
MQLFFVFEASHAARAESRTHGVLSIPFNIDPARGQVNPRLTGRLTRQLAGAAGKVYRRPRSSTTLRIMLLLLLGAVATGPLSAQAQNVTRVGVCSLAQVIQATWDKTAAAREFVRLRRGILDEFVHLDREIRAVESSPRTQARDEKLAAVRSYAEAYKTQRKDWMARIAASLKVGPVLGEIIAAVERVSRANGYALVIRSDTSFPLDRIVIAIPETDITADVIDDVLAHVPE